MTQRTQKHRALLAFAAEVGVYAAVVFGYFFLVLHFLGHWLKEMYDGNKLFYAVIALSLIVVQGGVLEFVTTWLFKLFHRLFKFKSI